MTRTTGASLCPFCRAPKAKSQQHAIALTKKLVEKNHSYATLHWAEFHAQGGGGWAESIVMGMELKRI